MKTSRRQFLHTGIGLAAGCTLADGLSASAASGPEKLPIGLQLYAVRGEFSRDVPGTLKEVRRMGYEGVELFGYSGTPNVYGDYSAKQLRQLLDEHGLKCCGIHLQKRALEADRLELTIENNKILGNPFLVVAGAREQMGSEGAIKAFAAFLNDVSAKCRSQEMWVGYHAHGFDFEKIQGRFAWDHLFGQTNPDVIMQMDVGNW